jgi:hypothetical protein
LAQGNPAMRAKRVTGASAQAIMLLHMKLERCSIEGCETPAVVTKNHTGVSKVRFCLDHVGTGKKASKEPFDPTALLKFGWA